MMKNRRITNYTKGIVFELVVVTVTLLLLVGICFIFGGVSI